MTTFDGAGLTDGQRLAAEQLAEIAAGSAGAVELVGTPRRTVDGQDVILDLSLDCGGITRTTDGVRLRSRERFELMIASDFPFSLPQVQVAHDRWAGTPHVQWGHIVCLYAAPSVEWVPADGMRGLLERLILWLRRAAVGELDPDGVALHPPVAYLSSSAASVVVFPDLPRDLEPMAGNPSTPELLVAVCTQRYHPRIDVTEWIKPAGWRQRFQLADMSGNFDEHGRRILGAAVVLLTTDIGFEYPRAVGALFAGLAKAGVDRNAVRELLSNVAKINKTLDNAHAIQHVAAAPRPLHLFIGTPSRRPAGETRRFTHLVCWRVDDLGKEFLFEEAQASAPPASDDEAGESLEQASISWAQVLEQRSLVAHRRDQESSAIWLADKKILVLGCGALGTPAAEICVRAGASEVIVADWGDVHPGILVRQPYADADIGNYKASALANRLNQVYRDDRVKPMPGNVLNTLLNESLPIDVYDLIIDATADAAVGSKLERCRATIGGKWPPILTLMIGHNARRGLVAVSRPDATGSGRDVLRRFAITACGSRRNQLADIADDFFPDPPRNELFHPEPGCSSPTFVGSAAETGALAGHLMTAALDTLSGRTGTSGQPMEVAAIRLNATTSGVTWVGWDNDFVLTDAATGYEVRISRAAIREMRAESVRGKRIRGRAIETGGMLLGQIDEACRCIWIDVATGPPPDSRISAYHFEHGTRGVQELIDHYYAYSRQTTAFVGMWHTHPDHPAQPSATDEGAMHRLLAPIVFDAPRAVLFILGGDETRWTAWLRDGVVPESYVRLVRRRDLAAALAPALPTGHSTSYWPGGYLTVPSGMQSDSRRRRWWLSWRGRFRRRRRSGHIG